MRHIITERMCGFLLQTSICWRTMSRRTRIIHELASRSTSKRFIHSRKGMSVIHSVGELNMTKMPNVSSSTVSVCLCGRRYTSDMKNDGMVKAWMSEIKDDFEKEKNLKPDTKAKDEVTRGGTDRLASDLDVDKLNEIKKTTSEKDNVDLDENRNTSAVTSEKAEDFIKPDVHGFTTEEMIELVKQARTSQTTGDSDERTTADGDDDYDDNDESDSSSSDSKNDDDDDSSSSSSDSDSDDSKDGTKEAENKANRSTEKQSQAETDTDSSELAWDDSDITRAVSNLRTELGIPSRKNKIIGMMGRKNRDVGSIEESYRQDEIIGMMGRNNRDLGLIEESDRQDEYAKPLVRKNRDVRTIEERFKNASDFVKREIEDFVNIDYEEPEEEVRTWEPPVPLTRGKTGVFDIEELVRVLESARAREIAVIKIPDDIDFANYMVIVTALSYRHIRAITTDLKWIYKRKKSKKDNTIKVDGEDTKDWFAFDLGNIILHVFTAETRAKYDLETLWTVGPKFDPKCQEEVKAPVFTLSDLPWLEELEQQGAAQETVTNQNSGRIPKKKRNSPNRETHV